MFELTTVIVDCNRGLRNGKSFELLVSLLKKFTFLYIYEFHYCFGTSKSQWMQNTFNLFLNNLILYSGTEASFKKLIKEKFLRLKIPLNYKVIQDNKYLFTQVGCSCSAQDILIICQNYVCGPRPRKIVQGQSLASLLF